MPNLSKPLFILLPIFIKYLSLNLSTSVWSPISTNVPGTVTLTGSYFDTYSTIEKMSPSFGYSVASICFNTISDIHFMYYKDIYYQNSALKKIRLQIHKKNCFSLSSALLCLDLDNRNICIVIRSQPDL